jgi:transposase-like protein
VFTVKRRKFTDEFKAKVVVEAIKGDKTARELSQEYGFHINQIILWKKQLIESVHRVFSRGKDREAEKLEKEKDQLYRKVVQLQIEVDWLKKKTGIN